MLDPIDYLVAPAESAVPARCETPRLSIVVPVFNAAGTVCEALESALTQLPPPSEVIVSDDGSTDDLDTALQPFTDRVRLVRGPNRGTSAARNRGAAVATGELIGLLDADDIWLQGRAAALTAAAARRPDLTIFTTDALSRPGRSARRANILCHPRF